ncbi:MAG: hypothetical protein ACYDA2_05795 [Acidimicrobiales bacterium]
MLYLVDTVTVADADVARYVELVGDRVRPVMTEAGATFEYCRCTDGGLGEPVEVQVAWSCADNAAWNVIRRNLVLDPRWYEATAALEPLRQGGTRRFYRGPSR